MSPKPASTHTANLNAEVMNLLNFGDEQDFEDVRRGFVADLEDRAIPSDDGGIAFDQSQYDFIEGDAPDTVNPSLWRQARLNRVSGLFTIHPKIHQVRGHDVSNMTLIEGDTGWVLIDPLTSVETARASLALANKHLGERPVAAIIYTHCHADHFGGVRGVVDATDVESCKVPIIAPDGFMQYAVSEWVIAGNVMNRRAQYQYGVRLPRSTTGHVCCGLGKDVPKGTISLIPPTDIIYKTGETRTVDGIEIEFQMANGSEAPAEFMFYFPQLRALCASEVTSHTMHNVLTPRGAECRNARAWAGYIDETITRYGDRTDVLFASHHWPTWDGARIRGFLERQRDLYQFIHDETLRLANHGYSMHEIPDMIDLPEGLRQDFACRGYYGTLKHDIKAVYQFYLGWWDGNPSTYDQLPPAESAKRFVRAMGGAAPIMAEGERARDEGDYRWAAEIMNKLVFADPENQPARDLLAEILEQMGYQAESASWRALYLTGAQELRDGIADLPTPKTTGPDVVSAMGVGGALDFLGIKFNPEKGAGKSFCIALHITDRNEVYTLETRNGVLGNRKAQPDHADLTMTLSETAFFNMLLQIKSVEELIAADELAMDGNPAVLATLFGILDDFDPSFPLVLPKQA